MIDYNMKIPSSPETEVLPAGEYNFTVIEAKVQDEPGLTPRVNLQLQVETKDGAVTIFQNLFITDKAMFQFGNCAKCLGFWKDDMSLSDFLYEVDGKEGRFELFIDTYNEIKKNKVKRWIKKEEPQKQETESVGLDISPDDLPF